MLEIPECITIANQLNSIIAGKTITEAKAAGSPHGFAWYFGEPQDYPARLNGRTVTLAEAVAGFVRITAQDSTILLNDGVNIRFYEKGAKIPAKHQLFIRFEDESFIACTVQMYGGLMVFPAGAFDNKYYRAAREKPSPLGRDFTKQYFEDIVKAAPVKTSAKALIGTEQRIPGLGNGCLQDILFNAGINPQTKTGALSSTETEKLYASLKNTLSKMAEQGGRDTEKDIFNKPGGYRTLMSSKTYMHPCPECGGPVTRKAFLGGNVYFCGQCQPVILKG